MKVKLHKVESKHDNACWCGAMALMLNKDYDYVYKLFKRLLYKNGSLDILIIKGYLLTQGYTVIAVSDLKLYEIINIYNTRSGVLIDLAKEGNEGHIIYMKDNIIYENEDNTYIQKMLYDYKVDSIIIKLENDYK